jgi:glycosyltransferase involved in cell wall biosynthesis
VVAVVAASVRLGGAERSVVEQAAVGARLGQRWRIASLEEEGGVVASLCEATHVPFDSFDAVWQLLMSVRHDRPDVVYVFGFRWSMIFRVARLLGMLGRGSGRTSLFSAQRGLDVWRRPIHNRVDRWSQHLVDRFVPNSNAASDLLVRDVGIDKDRIRAIPGGVSDEWLHPRALQRFAVDRACEIMLVGNYRPEKAYPDALRALSSVVDREWHATVFTDDATAIEELARANNLESRITALEGHRLAPDDYDRFDFLLHCASSESYPRAVVEAHSRGLMVVASDVGDVKQILGSARWIFSAGDVARATDLVREVIELEPDAAREQPAPVRSIEMVAIEFEELVASARQAASRA